MGDERPAEPDGGVGSAAAASAASSSNFSVASAWSKAGVGTSVVVEASSSGARIAFDIGATPSFAESIPASVVIVSHGHVDHVGAIFSHARAHAVTHGGSAATYYVPSTFVEKLEEARRAMSSIDAANDGSGARTDSLIAMKIVGVTPGEEVEIKQRKLRGGGRLFLRPFRVDHGGHPAMGYVIVSRGPPVLKDEYKGLPGTAIRDLVKSGVPIKIEAEDKPEVAYTGDTCALGLTYETDVDVDGDATVGARGASFLKQAFRAPLFICELTFLDDSDDGVQEQLARERGHMHISDVVPVLSSNGWCASDESVRVASRDSRIVFFHMSGRYGASYALNAIVNNIPRCIAVHCDVAISALIDRNTKEKDGSWLKLVQENGCIALSDYIAMGGASQVSLLESSG